MENKKIYHTGIWQGRFQYIHNGYYYVFKNELSKFENKMIAIVNPNPQYPPTKDFDGFKLVRNPFNYFQRMLMWKKIIDNQNWDVMMFPCWHGIYKIALENDFLPDRGKRCWIVPLSQHEAELDKAAALQRNGEHIYAADFEKEDPEYAVLNPAIIRKYINQNDDTYKKYLPKCIWDLTEELALQQEDLNKYYLIPVIGNKFDISSLQYALSKIKDESNSYIIFAVDVHVSKGEKEWKDKEHLPWWFKPAKHPEQGLKYYKRAEVIAEIMTLLSERRYFITPLFVYDKDLDILGEYNRAFLPDIENIRLVINKDYEAETEEFYKYNFRGWAVNAGLDENEIMIDGQKKISKEVVEVCIPNYASYISQPKTEYSTRIDILFEDIKKRVIDSIDDKINDLRDQIKMGGLSEKIKEEYDLKINSKYPELRMKYLGELKHNKNSLIYPNTDKEYDIIENTLEKKLKQLQKELEK